MVRFRLVVSSLLARMLWRFLTMRGKRRASRGGLYRTYSKESSYRASNPKWLMDVLKSTGGEVGQHVWEQCPDYQEYIRGDQEGAKCVLPLSPSCCERLFVLDPLVTYLNHGSYGATFRLALHTQQYVRDMMERQPVRFMETKALPGVLRALQLLAPWLGAASEDLVPVMNATSAVSTVVRSMKLKKADVIIMTSLTYPAVKSSLVREACGVGAKVVEVPWGLDEASEPDAMLQSLQAALSQYGGRVKLVVVDHVVSFPPVVVPVHKVCALCNRSNVMVFVDGAHALGCLAPFSVPDVGADFYTTNLHKWSCAPKGCAVLWCRREHQSWVRPLVTSHGAGQGYQAEFLWQGTADYSPWLALPACLTVIQSWGGPEVFYHNMRLLRCAVELLCEAWGNCMVLGGWQDLGETATQEEVSSTSSLKGHSSTTRAGLTSCCMAAVQIRGSPEALLSIAGALEVHDMLREEHNIEVPVAFWEGHLWVRISAYMYNCLEDYKQLAVAIPRVMDKACGAAALELNLKN